MMRGPEDFWGSRFRDKNPETYDFAQSRPSPILEPFCEKYFEKGAAVLDLGCGGGRNSHYLAQAGYRTYGVDVTAEAMVFCRKRFARFNLAGEFRRGTVDCIPFDDNYFAGIICIAVVDHVTLESARAAVVEMRRVLVDDGVILLTFDPPDRNQEALADAEMMPDGTLRFFRGEKAGMLFRRYKDDEIRSLVGKQHIISFDYSDEGDRLITCR